MNTLEKFIGVVKDPNGDCTLYGLYRGRFNHVGVAIECDTDHEYKCLCKDLAENDLDSLAWANTHKDNLGYGRVYSWDLRHFDDLTEEEIIEILNQHNSEDEEW